MVVEACGTVDAPTVAALPTTRNLIRTAKRVQAIENFMPNPRTLAELIFNEQSVTTANGQRFLLYDNGTNVAKRIVIFGTEKNLELLKETLINRFLIFPIDRLYQ